VNVRQMICAFLCTLPRNDRPEAPLPTLESHAIAWGGSTATPHCAHSRCALTTVPTPIACGRRRDYTYTMPVCAHQPNGRVNVSVIATTFPAPPITQLICPGTS